METVLTEANAPKVRRKPTQSRSIKRVEAILHAAKSLIAEKGSARLKIHDIATRANVTPASIYQYFPNKNAIILALANTVFDEAGSALEQSLPKLKNSEELYAVLQELVERYYQVYLNDPAMVDVWFSISTDKSVQDLDLQDSRRNAALISDCIKQFYDEAYWPKIDSVSFLLAHLSGSAVRMALSVKAQEGRALIDSFKSMLNPHFIDAMLKAQENKVA